MTKKTENGQATTYALVEWCVEDILEKRPNWTKEQAEKFLEKIEDELAERMIQTGWDVIDDNLKEE